MAFNFRSDRMRQLTGMLTREGIPDYVMADLLVDRDKPVRAFQKHYLATMTSYGESFDLPVAFPKENLRRTLGQLLSEAGLSQLRCAETEKFPHVTYFFNGGREQPFDGETRTVVPSPRLVDTYDEKPEMSASKVCAAVVQAIHAGDNDFICVNFANPDMLGHTGKLEAATAAVQAVDTAIGSIVDALGRSGGALIVTADHGNCETMVDSAGRPHTAHTTNPVPFVYFDTNADTRTLRDGGSLIDVAPTVLDLLGVEQPEVMTGRSLLTDIE
jgi:2,3-bisphosphoglycerate-independent phosphoglycerate mutase